MATGRELRTLEQGRDPLNDVAFSTDGRFVIASSDDALKVWEVATGKLRNTLPLHKCLALSAGGSLAVSAPEDGILKVWDISAALEAGVAPPRELGTLPGSSAMAKGIALSAASRLAVSTLDKGLIAWDISAKPTLIPYEGVELNVNIPISLLTTSVSLSCCSITPNGKIVIVGDEGGEVHFLELVVGRETRERSNWWPLWLKRLLEKKG